MSTTLEIPPWFAEPKEQNRNTTCLPISKEGEPGDRIYVKDGVPLNRSDKEACDHVGVEPDKLKAAKKDNDKLDLAIRNFMCSNFYDIRTFGAVMTTVVPPPRGRTG